jgi:hypothetical protein
MAWTSAGVAGPRFHRGLHSGRQQGLAGAQHNGRSGARWLTGNGAMEKGARGESVSGLTGARTAVWRPGDSCKEAGAVALGVGGASVWEEEKESGRRCGGGRRGSPLL